MYSKLGFSNTLVGIILILVAGGILFVFVSNSFGIGREAAEINACKTNVDLAYKYKLGGKTYLGNVECNTLYNKIKTTNEFEIKEEISKHMFTCWDKFGEGKKDFISDWRGDTWCNICNIIEFENNVQEKLPIVNNLDFHLRTEEIPLVGETYYDYIYGESNFANLEEDFSFSTEKDFYIVFFADKNRQVSDVFKGIGITTTGIGVCIGGFIITGGLGAIATCAKGVGLLTTGVAYAIKNHDEFVSGLYVGNDEEILEACG